MAGMEEAEVPGPHSRRHQSSDSDCAAVAEAGGRREGEDRDRSLLAQLPMGCPAGAVGARHRAGMGPGLGSGRSGGK